MLDVLGILCLKDLCVMIVKKELNSHQMVSVLRNAMKQDLLSRKVIANLNVTISGDLTKD